MTLNFENQPLTEVVTAIEFREVSISLELCGRVAKSLEPAGFEVDSVGIGSEIAEDEPHLQLNNPQQGLVLELWADSIVVRWSKDHGVDYPRYVALREAVAKAWGELPAPERVRGLDSCAMSYLSEDPAGALEEAKGLQDLVASEILPCIQDPEADIMFHSSVWRPTPSLEISLEARVTNSGGGYIRTAAGVPADPDPLLALDEAHQQMISRFLSLISPSTKTRWKFRA